MATKVFTLLELIAKRGSIIRVSKIMDKRMNSSPRQLNHIFLRQAPTVPNSLASADLWERLFGSNSIENEKNEDEVIAEQSEDPSVDAVPHMIATSQMIQARQDYSKEYWRTLVRETRVARSNTLSQVEEVRVPRTMNIQASLGQEYLYFAQ